MIATFVASCGGIALPTRLRPVKKHIAPAMAEGVLLALTGHRQRPPRRLRPFMGTQAVGYVMSSGRLTAAGESFSCQLISKHPIKV